VSPNTSIIFRAQYNALGGSVIRNFKTLYLNQFFTGSRPTLGPTQCPIQWVPGSLSPVIERQRREAEGACSCSGCIEAANCAAIQEIPNNFKEPEGSSPRSQEPFTGPYPEPDRSSPYHPIPSYLSKMYFNIVHPPTSWSS
jgi:hypothetical protein